MFARAAAVQQQHQLLHPLLLAAAVLLLVTRQCQGLLPGPCPSIAPRPLAPAAPARHPSHCHPQQQQQHRNLRCLRWQQRYGSGGYRQAVLLLPRRVAEEGGADTSLPKPGDVDHSDQLEAGAEQEGGTGDAAAAGDAQGPALGQQQEQQQLGERQGTWRLLSSFMQRRWQLALAKVRAEPLQTLTIPLTAAFVGWFTNKLAVDMIFYPLKWRGIPLRVIEGEPLGLLGWQGIVPAKAAVMGGRMTDIVTTQLLDVQEVFGRLNPKHVARLLAPEIVPLAQEVAGDILPSQLMWLPESAALGLSAGQVERVLQLQQRMLVRLVKDLQKNVESLLDLKEVVVGAVVADRKILVDLFKKCGREEFPFLVNSGLWLGFLLGLIQMVLWLLCDKAWTIPVGGFVVGLITNLIAIKLIFEPVDPVYWGPFKLQGLFLRRQGEVSAEFADYFTANVVNSRKIWHVVLYGSRAPAAAALLRKHLVPFVKQASSIANLPVDDDLARGLADKVTAHLGDHVHVLHEYVDKTLRLRDTINVQMQAMSSRTFENVLHPVFQEDEFTLIVAGGALGLIAGLLQMTFTTQDKQDSEGAGAAEGGGGGKALAATVRRAMAALLSAWAVLLRPAVATGRVARALLLAAVARVLGQQRQQQPPPPPPPADPDGTSA